MAKKMRQPKQQQPMDDDMDMGLPPEGLWVSPTGQQENVNEHLLSIKNHPEQFGFTQQQVAALDLDAIRRLAEGLIDKGWTRYRYLDGIYHFEVDDAQRRINIIDNILIQARAIPQESMMITQRLSPKTFEGTVGDFFDRVFFRFAKKNVKADSWAWKTVVVSYNKKRRKEQGLG